MCELLKKEKADVERKLGSIRGVSIVAAFFIINKWNQNTKESSILLKLNYLESTKSKQELFLLVYFIVKVL